MEPKKQTNDLQCKPYNVDTFAVPDLLMYKQMLKDVSSLT